MDIEFSAEDEIFREESKPFSIMACRTPIFAQGNNSEETEFAFRMIYVVVPVLSMMLAYLSIRGFKLDVAEQEKLQAQITARDATNF